MDPVRGPLVVKVFELYATGRYSPKAVTAEAWAMGLTHPRSGRRLSKSEVHPVLHDPIYYGVFEWKGKRYVGQHEPLIREE